ncbi:MAG TPA: gliding motility-associated C-terminal domain-containing protein, partial [Bacteroidia bacterium]|nr:gliding motility-associated C-terminal domain-containing protein [Bacteroidia bacterium]
TTYHWSTGSNSASIYVHNAGTYTVAGTTAGCTSAAASTTVSVIPLVASFSATPSSGTAPLNVALTNNSVGATGYTWNFGNGGTSILQNPNTSYPNVGMYTVTLTATVGLCVESYSQIIIVNEPTASIIIPNIFTPNGDGINEVFAITGAGISDFSCIIYDRWGIEMFESSSITISWDGKTKNGVAVPDGVYFYIINAKGNNLPANTYKGYVTLIR